MNNQKTLCYLEKGKFPKGGEVRRRLTSTILSYAPALPSPQASMGVFHRTALGHSVH